MLLILAASLVVAPVGAQERGQEEPVLAEVEPRAAREGETVEVRGSGWEPGGQIEVSYRGRSMGFATTAPDGTWETEIAVPDVEPPTSIELEVSGVAVTGEETTFPVTLDVTTATPRGTWIVVGVVAAIVLVIVLLGAAMLMRRRRPPLRQQMAEGGTPVRNPDPRKEPQPRDEPR